MFRLCSFLLVLTLATPAGAIVNLEGLHLNEPRPGWSGALGLSLSGNEGNTRTLNVDGDVRLNWRRDPVLRLLLAHAAYGESRGVKARDKDFLHLREIHRYHPRRAWEAYVQAERDAFARLRLRALAGGGLRLSLGAGPRRTALLGLGAFYSRERLADGDGGELLNYGQWRGNVYLILKHRLSAGRRLWLTTYLQPDLARPDDVRLLATAGAAMDVSEAWRLTWSMNYVYDARPPLGVRHFDLSYRAGLSFSF